jgi:phage gp46-like protein
MRLIYDRTTGFFDIGLTGAGGLDPGIGNAGALEAAVWVSLFTDLLADPADMTPELGGDRRGWWGDSGRAPDASMGSLIWLHRREKKSETVRLKVENAAREALQWLIDDGIASDVTVEAFFPAQGQAGGPRDALALVVTLTEPNGVRRDWKVDLLWSGVF